MLSGLNQLRTAGSMLRGLLQWPRPLPLEDERVRLLHEVRVRFHHVLGLRFMHCLLAETSACFHFQVGTELERSFDGKAVNLVAAAKGSALALVHLVTNHFPGTRVKLL